MSAETLSLSSRFAINSSLVLSVDELKNSYLFGIPISNRSGIYISDTTIRRYIEVAQKQLEDYLSIKINRQMYQESLSFTAEEFYNWSYLRCTYPIEKAMLLEGFLNTTKQVTYPKDWLTSKVSSDGLNYHRNLFIVPAGNATGLTQAQLFTGMIPNLTYLGLARIPNYWTVTYVTGFKRSQIPMNIIDCVAKLAALNIFRISGDLIIAPGIGSFSLSIDGLSQSQSIKAFDNRIREMYNDLTTNLIPLLKDTYRGLLMASC